ncbi:2-oxoglutarate oxidoreductase, beta subunit, partial [hydrothermal vent metagenome]
TRQGTAALDAVLLGLGVLETTFIARGFTRAPNQLRRLTTTALTHARQGRGFAFLEVLSPCVTYNDTYPQWEAEHIDLDTDETYDPTNRTAAFTRVIELETQGRIPVGVIYHDPTTEPTVFPNPATADIDPRVNVGSYDTIIDRYRI